MLRTAPPAKLIASLNAKQARRRALAAAYLGDLLEGGALVGSELAEVLRALMISAVAESDDQARESMFNSLSIAAAVGMRIDIDWSPIADQLENLDAECLQHALEILGHSNDARFLDRVAKFRDHANADVRSEAQDAYQSLSELPSLSRRRSG